MVLPSNIFHRFFWFPRFSLVQFEFTQLVQLKICDQVQRKFELGWDKETLGSKVSFTGKAETLVYLKPVLEITVYKMFKVAFVFKTGYELVFLLEASYNFDSFSCSANLKKYITFDVALNASANFFGRQLFEKDFKLYTNKWKLDDDTEDCSLSPEGTSTSPSTSVATTSLTSSATSASAPATDDGCACKKSWTLTSGASCSNYCCALEGHDRHLCIKDRDPREPHTCHHMIHRFSCK